MFLGLNQQKAVFILKSVLSDDEKYTFLSHIKVNSALKQNGIYFKMKKPSSFLMRVF